MPLCLFLAPGAAGSIGQASLPNTCPVCAHSPVSADLCKPNKALRTTLKAFLRTEEKKREKERQSAAPATSEIDTSVENEATHAEPAADRNSSREAVVAQSGVVLSQASVSAENAAGSTTSPVLGPADSEVPASASSTKEVWHHTTWFCSGNATAC